MRLTLALIGILLSQLSLAQTIIKTPIPEWVDIRDTLLESQVNTYDVQDGYYYLNYDQCTHHASETFFIRSKAKILNTAGVDNLSQINISIDTSYQTIEFHSLIIDRNGKKIDRTQDVEFKLINDEMAMKENVFSGVMLANTILVDIRKGDIVEVAYSTIGVNPLYKDQLHQLYYLQGFNHVDHMSFRFIAPRGLDFDSRILVTDHLDIAKYSTEADTIIDIHGYHIEPAYLEESMSFSADPFNLIELSSHATWASVVTWAESLFVKGDYAEVDSIFEEVTTGKKTLLEKATSILDHVQNTIRYTSVNGGIGSLKATPSGEVIRRNYGDCKDKSLLLYQLLDKLTFDDVSLVLVNSSYGKSLNKHLPGTALFDHVIVRCQKGKETYWVDPSLYLQGGSFEDRHSYDYGYGLVINEQTQQLTRMDITTDVSRTEVYETFDLSNVNGDGTLQVVSKFKGKNADYFRNLFDQYSPKDLAESFKEAYSTIFLNVKSESSLSIEDDYENNVLTMKESYILVEPWKKNEEKGIEVYMISFEPMNLYNYVQPISCDSILYPIDVDKNVTYLQKTSMKLPKDALYKLNNFETENAIYSFNKSQTIQSLKATEIVYDIMYHKDQILPEDYDAYCRDMNDDCRNLLMNLVWFKQ